MFTSYSRVNPMRIVKKQSFSHYHKLGLTAKLYIYTDWSWANYLKSAVFAQCYTVSIQNAA